MSSPLHIWITGAGRGIGAAIATALGTKHHVTLSGRHESSLRDIEKGIPAGNASVVECDVSDHESVARAYKAAVAVHGPVNILINNAGIAVFKSMLDLSINEFDAQIASNLRGTFLCTKSALPWMLENSQGMIITINSVSALQAFSGCTGYAASKAGTLGLTRSLRAEVRGNGIKVCDVFLGATSTEIWDPETIAKHEERMMLKQDVVQAIEFLVDGYHNPRTHIEEIVIRPQNGDLP